MAWTNPATATAGSTALTAAFWNTNVRDNTNELYATSRRLAYQTRTTNYTINQSALASAADVFSSDLTFTADGSSYRIVFYAPIIESGQTANSFIRIYLVDGSGTDLGQIGLVGYGDGTRSALQGSVFTEFFYTPSAGSVSLNIRLVFVTAAGAMTAGTGGAGAYFPAYMAVYGPAIT